MALVADFSMLPVFVISFYFLSMLTKLPEARPACKVLYCVRISVIFLMYYNFPSVSVPNIFFFLEWQFL